jgi:hypothetical protein
MNRISCFLATAIILLTLTAPALAQYRRWPAPLPASPAWGDYDRGHVWHDASWWWQNQPGWVRANHPEWWGDFY